MLHQGDGGPLADAERPGEYGDSFTSGSIIDREDSRETLIIPRTQMSNTSQSYTNQRYLPNRNSEMS